MSERTLTYEGFTLSAHIEPAAETDLWSAVLTISRGEDRDRGSWIFSAGEAYNSPEEAAERCFEFAREVIDREMKGCSLE
jgi:hypothetical protein